MKEGTSVTLACHAEGNPTPAITWRRGDQLIHTGPSLTLAQVLLVQLVSSGQNGGRTSTLYSEFFLRLVHYGRNLLSNKIKNGYVAVLILPGRTL